MSRTQTTSFRECEPSSLASSRAKQANRSENMKHEMLLRKTLHKMGLRFKKNVKNLPGKPDIVFTRAGVVVFCDGDFWHGRNWKSLKQKLIHGANGNYWTAKIYSNIVRDKQITKELTRLEWRVIRVWETDVLADPFSIANQIAGVVRSRSKRIRQKTVTNKGVFTNEVC